MTGISDKFVRHLVPAKKSERHHRPPLAGHGELRINCTRHAELEVLWLPCIFPLLVNNNSRPSEGIDSGVGKSAEEMRELKSAFMTGTQTSIATDIGPNAEGMVQVSTYPTGNNPK